MSDSEFEELFTELRHQQPPTPFAPAAAVRRRGRQRTRRQATAVGVAVLAVLGLGAASLVPVAGQPALLSPLAPANTPALTEVPDEWLLTGDDLGRGWSFTASNELLVGAPPWFWSGYCGGTSRELDHPSLSQRSALQAGSWQNDQLPPPGRIDQVVEVFGSVDAAEANLIDVRSVVRHCYRLVALEVVETGFAGDESLLVQEEPYASGWGEDVELYARTVAVVRVDGAVTTLVFAGDADVRQLARRAADRLS